MGEMKAHETPPLNLLQIREYSWWPNSKYRFSGNIYNSFVSAKLLQSCLTLCGPHGLLACRAPLSMGFSRQGYWSGLPCPPAGHLPDPGIKHMLPALQAGSLLLSHLGSPSTIVPPSNGWIIWDTGQNSERDGHTRPPNLPLEKPVCR